MEGHGVDGGGGVSEAGGVYGHCTDTRHGGGGGLEAEVKSLQEMVKPTSLIVQMGEFARRWRGGVVIAAVGIRGEWG